MLLTGMWYIWPGIKRKGTMGSISKSTWNPFGITYFELHWISVVPRAFKKRNELTKTFLVMNRALSKKQTDGPRALDRPPESWHMNRWCIGLCLRRYDIKIFLILALAAVLLSKAIPSDQFLKSATWEPFISVKLFWFWTSGSGENGI